MKTILLFFLFTTIALCADVTGKWAGRYEAKLSNGEGRADNAVFIFQTNGGKLKGTAGPDENDQHEFRTVNVEGKVITCEFDENGSSAKLRFTWDGDSMTGEGVITRDGQSMTARFDLKRVK